MRVPLWKGGAPASIVEQAPRASLDTACTACDLHENTNTVCMRAEVVRSGQEPRLLVVLPAPTREDDRRSRPLVTGPGRHLRKLIDEHWQGQVVYDHAIKCTPGRVDVTKKRYAACRPYLASVLDQAKPHRVLLVGSGAQYGVLGRAAPTQSVRSAWAYLPTVDAFAFMVDAPARMTQNRLLRRRWEGDVQRALTRPDPPRSYVWDAEAVVITNEATLAEARAALAEASWVAFDVETVGKLHARGQGKGPHGVHPWWPTHDFRIISIALTPAQSRMTFVWDEDSLEWRDALDVLLPVLTSETVGKVAHNAKYDCHAVYTRFGIEISSVYADTMLWRKLLSADVLGRLEYAAELVGLGGHKEEADAYVDKEAKRLRKACKDAGVEPVPPAGEFKSWAFEALPWEVLVRYNARDTLTTALLVDLLEPPLMTAFLPRTQAQTSAGPLWRTWRRALAPAIPAVCQIERWGVHVSREGADAVGHYFDTITADLTRKLESHATINWASPPQLAKLLYDDLGLPCSKETKGGARSTDKEALAPLRGKHPVVDMLIEWRHINKLRSTYVDGLVAAIHPSTGRVHPDFDLAGTRSGRLSCLAEGVLVVTDRGTVPVEQVLVGDLVFTHKERWRHVLAHWHVGTRSAYDVHLSNGEVLTCTGNHRLLASDGEWVTVEVLRGRFAHARGAQDRSLLAGEGLAVVAVEAVYARGNREVYDLTVEDDESYMAGGVFSHNCRQPNVQNIPRADTPEGKMLRDLFSAPPGYVILQADYSQLELRIAALMSGDERMKEIYKAGEDYHMRTAQMISRLAWGIEPGACTKVHRSAAKVVNFSVLYGKSAYNMADEIGCTVNEAERIMNGIFGAFPDLAAWIEERKRETRHSGACWTTWNGERARRRPLWGIADPNSGVAGNAERSSYNTPIQGSASDYCLMSLPAIVNWIKDNGVPAKLVLTVHDSVLLEVREDVLDMVARNVRRLMEQWPCGDVPLVADLESGPAWGSLGKMEVPR